MPAPQIADDLRAALERAVGDAHVSDDPHDRVVHARGKSLRDLVRQRRGDLGRVPDVVVRPGDEAEVSEILRAALDADAVVIPFGGGTSISGSLEAPAAETRTVISVDLARMDAVLGIDATSRLARVQAGVYGPRLEEQLNARGYTFGHYPDSFTHSTLGGWIATRSSGMQSDRYGDIADATRGLRVVTPAGLLVTRPVPATSTGPSVREMVLGQRGPPGDHLRGDRAGAAHARRAHDPRLPAAELGRLARGDARHRGQRGGAVGHARRGRQRDGLLVRDEEGLVARRQAPVQGAQDVPRAPQGLRRRARCASASSATRGRSPTSRRSARRSGASSPTTAGSASASSPGELYDQKKFDTPYIRDYLLDRGVLGDVSETSAPWGTLPGFYEAAVAAARGAFAELGVMGYVMCHMSHSYHAGACLYFTFAMTPSGKRDGLEEYLVVKSAVQQAFVDNGGTLSHHHAVGTEHAEWLEQDISAPGVGMLRALFDGTDPGNNLNPGKIV